ncbi:MULTISPECIES: hypothetical protein [Pseudothermotoga]|uniref:Uncharacterized protein n=1 Tax=Pseudothermotoga lettingae (strain ATCC BAA-301 / DSM 14385 / NBRC 107922 / TMO) TaxID=416591 RepID=A8F5B7_PSELT|nr:MULTISPECIES: hypothetical protein [Pseudothermotoga]ABV33351.1 conserved hypothetical protein [Pseudothermotoga lettingae TMO]KUK21234.1 MAG: Uncharacterized protein XD56_0849 [Pseudothermotoga lettingae]MDI3493997.1 hypothetical protein [Pseudothermotoga sp.]MDK2884478.1 hypothetical protein [Pseudothermotoga sp.]GLI49733.1 hypothetical protein PLETTINGATMO_19020 [Pseudothermotoga lettingae TMO]
MWFFKKKKKSEQDLLTNPFYKEGNLFVIYFKCEKCGEYFRSHLRAGYDFIIDYDNPSTPYKVDKIYVGSKCPNKIHLIATMSSSYKLRTVTLEGGKFITKEEYESVQKKEDEK